MATPRPWFPSCGLTTTGTPISHAARHASSASLTGRPHGVGNPDRAEHHAGHFLVLCNRLGDRAGPIGLGGLDATLLPAVAEQHQAIVVQPAIRNASLADGFDDGSRAGAKAYFVGEIPQPLDFCRRR